MLTGSYRFMLGAFECFALRDGFYRYHLEDMFSNVPKAQIETVLQQSGLTTDYVETPYTCLLIRTAAQWVLIDVGAGSLASTTGQLVDNLQAVGVQPSDIDTIIITHAHPDHIGGNLDVQGNPRFPKARYFMSRREWNFWTKDAMGANFSWFASFVRQQLEPVLNRIQWLDGNTEILDGLQVVEAPGHTPGQIALWLSSQGKRLLHVSDVVLHPLHLEHPDWLPVYDIMPDQAAATKHHLFNTAAETHTLVFAHHFPPFPNLGLIMKQGDHWRWKPLSISYLPSLKR
jgi:glyoxylase-like metal-dependent hydrolase (beta-lactamase superfamily II)